MASKQVEGEHAGQKYAVVATGYSDTLHIMVYKNEKIAKMFKCNLYPQPGGVISPDLVVPGLTPQPLIGTSPDDTAGMLYTQMISSLVLKHSPDESRQVVLGLGNVGPRNTGEITQAHREELLFIIKLVEDARIW